MRTLRVPRGNFNAVCYTADGEFLVGLHSGRRLRVWATSDFAERYSAALTGLGYAHSFLALAGDLAVLDRGVYDLADLWAALRGRRGPVKGPDLIREVILKEPESSLAYVSYATDGRVIARVYVNYSAWAVDVTFWDRGRLARSLSFPRVRNPHVVLTPAGSTLALLSDHHVLLYDRTSGVEVARLEHTDYPNRAVYSPDGNHLAVAAGRSLWLWDLAEGKGQRYPAFETFVEGLAYSPDGSRLAAADRTGEIRLLEMPSGRQLGCLNFEVGAIHGLAFSPDGMTVAGAGHDNAVVVWDLE